MNVAYTRFRAHKLHGKGQVMSARTRVADRRYMAKKLSSARAQARKGDWGFAEVYLNVGRVPHALASDIQQFENCVYMMCRHEVLKEYARTTWCGKGHVW